MSSLTLFLDLASNTQSIAIVDESRVLAHSAVESKTGEQQLIPLIDGLLNKSNCTYQDLSRIAATTGPGGFMSLRVGISLANALSDSLSIPLTGIHLSDLWHERVIDQKNFLWIHSTKKEFLFIRGFGELATKWPEPVLVSLEEARLALDRSISYVGELIEAQQTVLTKLAPLQEILPLEKVLPDVLKKLSYDKKLLMPWYGRGA